MATSQITLLSWWFSIKNPTKKINQKDIVKTVGSKLTCPKWHFGQVRHGGKTTIGGAFFYQNFWSKKP